MLLVPQQGRLMLTTELGRLALAPGEIGVVPRGMAFSVELPDGPSRGYVCENDGAHFRLPELGPIGSNGLARARDFLAPTAAFDAASTALLTPRKLDNTRAFVFESRYRFVPIAFAMQGAALDAAYAGCWQDLQDHFKGQPP